MVVLQPQPPLSVRRMMKELTFENINQPDDDDEKNSGSNGENDSSSAAQKKLGIPILLNPMTTQDADAIKLEATEMVNDIVAAGMDELQTLRQQLNDDIATSNQQRDRISQIQMQQAQTKLLNKIDGLTQQFLQSTQSSRTSTQLAAQADQSVPSGQGVDLGAWGMVNGRYVVTNGGLLGGSRSTSSSRSDDVASPTTLSTRNIRMMVIADPSSDQYAKLLLGPLEQSLKNVLVSSSASSSSPSSFEMITYKPTATIPIGNTQNAAALLIFLTSLNDVSTLQNMMDRIYRKTLSTDGTVTTVPPTQIILLTTVGTTRTEKMPYSFQNLMSGNQLTKRRQMEEYIVRYVQQQQQQNIGIDFTICHLGNEIKPETKEAFQLLPGDTLEGSGIVTMDTAVTVLTHAIALQPYARNATFSCTGKLPSNEEAVVLLLDDAFLKCDGPEVLRTDHLGHSIDQLDVLTEYICEWAELLCASGKGILTTPVRLEVVSAAASSNPILPSGVIQQSPSIVRLLFQPTNTGKYYVSKDDEREIASSRNNADGTSSSSTPPPPVRASRLAKEGGLEFVMEAVPRPPTDNDGPELQLRIRVKRCNYNYDTIIKELSEQTIIGQFKKCIEVWKNRS